ncbi:hypothetical protein DI487_10140 [Flavobacterium sediminis]|uniref:Uncharacterized protein n=1 Tax=Flavobacterium sediminis TaxID=2201181 RepID=A0A2U8QVW2_9FLAO|nr:hypothetical protein DI487_10140 [Flavobacterium sediminis]
MNNSCLLANDRALKFRALSFKLLLFVANKISKYNFLRLNADSQTKIGEDTLVCSNKEKRNIPILKILIQKYYYEAD